MHLVRFGNPVQLHTVIQLHPRTMTWPQGHGPLPLQGFPNQEMSKLRYIRSSHHHTAHPQKVEL